MTLLLYLIFGWRLSNIHVSENICANRIWWSMIDNIFLTLCINRNSCYRKRAPHKTNIEIIRCMIGACFCADKFSRYRWRGNVLRATMMIYFMADIMDIGSDVWWANCGCKSICGYIICKFGRMDPVSFQFFSPKTQYQYFTRKSTNTQ